MLRILCALALVCIAAISLCGQQQPVTLNIFLHRSGVPEMTYERIAGSSAMRMTAVGERRFSLIEVVPARTVTYRVWAEGPPPVNVTMMELRRRLYEAENAVCLQRPQKTRDYPQRTTGR